MARIIRLTPEEHIFVADDGDVSIQFIDPDTKMAESMGLLVPSDPDKMTDEEIIAIYRDIFPF